MPSPSNYNALLEEARRRADDMFFKEGEYRNGYIVGHAAYYRLMEKADRSVRTRAHKQVLEELVAKNNLGERVDRFCAILTLLGSERIKDTNSHRTYPAIIWSDELYYKRHGYEEKTDEDTTNT